MGAHCLLTSNICNYSVLRSSRHNIVVVLLQVHSLYFKCRMQNAERTYPTELEHRIKYSMRFMVRSIQHPVPPRTPLKQGHQQMAKGMALLQLAVSLSISKQSHSIIFLKRPWRSGVRPVDGPCPARCNLKPRHHQHMLRSIRDTPYLEPAYNPDDLRAAHAITLPAPLHALGHASSTCCPRTLGSSPCRASGCARPHRAAHNSHGRHPIAINLLRMAQCSCPTAYLSHGLEESRGSSRRKNCGHPRRNHGPPRGK
jgi:hypothetical protein